MRKGGVTDVILKRRTLNTKKMQITENTNYFTGETDYSIFLKPEDDLETFDIAECFKEQYPKKICVISFLKVVQMEFGFLIIGLNLKHKRTKL